MVTSEKFVMVCGGFKDCKSYKIALNCTIFLQVPFGKVVKCPSCMIAVAVAQPQQGVQACAYISII